MGSLLACQLEVANRLVPGLGLTPSALSLPCRDLCQGLDRTLLLARLTRLILSGRRAPLPHLSLLLWLCEPFPQPPRLPGGLALGKSPTYFPKEISKKRIPGSSPSSHGSWLPFGPGGGGEPTSFFWATTPWFLLCLVPAEPVSGWLESSRFPAFLWPGFLSGLLYWVRYASVYLALWANLWILAPTHCPAKDPCALCYGSFE
jgi:hypothetical protein